MTAETTSANNSSSRASRKLRVAYTAAAGAAACVAGNSADAAVVYSGPQYISVGSGFSQNINIDGDAFQDINLQNFNFGGGPYQGAGAVFFPGKLAGFTSGNAYVSALAFGALIDGTTVSIPGGSMAYGAMNPNAQFNNVTDAYIGIGFPAGANFYYGWLRVNVNNAAKTLLIKDWAYDNVSGTGILAGAGIVPEPGTLGLLAAGALGIAALRRKRAS